MGKKWLDFGDFEGHYIIKTPKMSHVKSLCAHYLYNQWLEFDKTSTDTLSGWGKKWLDFGDLDLISKVTTLSILNKWVLCAPYLMNQ